MQTKSSLLSFAIKAGLCAVLALDLTAQSQDHDKKLAPAEYWNIGVWNGNGPGASGGPDSKMQLHLNSPNRDKLYGYVTEWSPLGDPIGTGIYGGKIIADEVSFTVENVLSKTTLKYKGKITGDVIKGTVEITRGGETTTRNWIAKREQKEKQLR
jgi:hypothetical protein